MFAPQVSRLTAEPNGGLFCAHAAIREQTARTLGGYAAWMGVAPAVNVPAVLGTLLHGLQVCVPDSAVAREDPTDAEG